MNPATPEFDRLGNDVMLPFVPLEAVWPGGLDTSRRKAKSDASTGYTRFVEGDIVLPKITPTFQADRTTIAVGLDGGVAAGTTELHVVRPGPGVDRRYVRYLLSSRPFLHGGEAEMIGVAGQKRVPDAWLRDFAVPVTDLAEQRAIADFLDAETARIDALIAKKRRLIDLLGERRAGAVEQAIRGLVSDHGEEPLKFAAPEILVGIVVTPAAFYADVGVPALRGINVKPGVLDLADLVYLSHDGHALHMKSQLKAGDVVVVRTGQAGAACVVPTTLDGANCVDLLIVRKAESLHPAYLEFVLNSDWTVKHIAEHSVGTIQSHFNVGALKQLPIPVPPLAVQERVVASLTSTVAAIDDVHRKIDVQVSLLVEHRQALITAAVTGELDVPEVAA